MPLLMNIAIDISARLSRRVSYFEYKGIRFKLVQNDPRRHSDILLTLVDLNDTSAQDRAYAAAAEWLSAVAWENGSYAAIRDTTSFGVRPPTTLRQCRPRVLTHPEIHFGAGLRGQDILVIPNVETEEQRIALALIREATSSNKVWLAILFYWQILEVAGTDAVAWVNRVYYRDQKVHVDEFLVKGLDLRGRRMGECFQEEGRHAIAHIRRKPGRRVLRFDEKPEIRRLNTTAHVLGKFAAHYIRTELRLARRMHLVRRRGRGFPIYVDEETLNHGRWTSAYRRRRPTTK